MERDGALVLPGLVNGHTHLYSALARGMPGPPVAPRSFVEVLERVWWRLDRALDEESVYLSGLVAAVEAARLEFTTGNSTADKEEGSWRPTRKSWPSRRRTRSPT